MASALPRLHLAAGRGDEGKLKQFLTAGDNVDTRAADGRSALLVAALGGHSKCVEILLAAGADPSASDNGKFFPLYVAAQNKNIAIASSLIRRLLEGGANVNQSGPNGSSALHTAARLGFDEVLNILIAAGADVDQRDRAEETPLHTTAYYGKPQCAWVLLRAGANVSAKNLQGSLPLHAAACHGHTDVIEVLLGAGAQVDVNLEDNLNRTPLSLASAYADVKAVNLLLDAGAHVNRPNRIGKTAIFGSSELKVVKTLLDRGAEVKILSKHGATVLHSAGYRGLSAGVICSLFKAGADPTVKDTMDKTAADAARIAGHEDAAKLLDLLAAKHRAMNST